jgi:hypothetical protein
VVGGAFSSVQLPFELPVGGVGADHLHQMAAGAGQVGGVEAPGMLDQGGFTAGPDRSARRQGLDGLHDDVGLLG